MKIVHGYVLEATAHPSAEELSYDQMNGVGTILLNSTPDCKGDDLNDAPYSCNGTIFTGQTHSLNKGDYVIIIKGRAS